MDLTVTDLGHTPNWLLVSDIVNASSRAYRTPRQVRISSALYVCGVRISSALFECECFTFRIIVFDNSIQILDGHWLA